MLKQLMALAVGALCLSAYSASLTLRSGGSLQLPWDKEGFLPWMKVNGLALTAMGRKPATADGVEYDFVSRGKVLGRGRAQVKKSECGALDVLWLFEPAEDVKTLEYGITCSLDVGKFPRESIEIDNQGRSIAIRELSLAFPEEAKANVSDGRWAYPFHSCYNLRVSARSTNVSAKDPQQLSCRVKSRDNSVYELAYAGNYIATPTNGWVVLDYRKDVVPGSALDFSRFGLTDAPAGKYGWPIYRGDHVEFEGLPGKAQRLCGVNLCGEACYPKTREVAARLAERLYRLGYNAVRIHHHDGLCARYRNGVLELDPVMMDRLDMLVDECIKRGLCLTTDLYVSRRIAWRDVGVDRDGNIPHTKVWQMTTENGWRDWAAYARLTLEHVNRYTGRAYKDEPALGFISVKNETCDGAFSEMAADPQFRIKDQWRDFLLEERRRNPKAFPGFDPEVLPKDGLWWDEHALTAVKSAFWASLDRAFMAKAVQYLRTELNVKALLTGENFGPTQAYIQEMRADCYDYSDTHLYVNGWWSWLGKNGYSLPVNLKNLNPFQAKSSPLDSYPYQRLWGKPFTVTEWDFVGPSAHRSVGGLAFGSVAAIQGWEGIWRFAYEHGDRNLEDNTGLPELYNLARDPLKLASDRATVCLYLRQDMPQAEDCLSLDYDEASLDRTQDRTYGSTPVWTRNTVSWTRRVGVSVRGKGVPPGSTVLAKSKVNDLKESPLEEQSSPFVEIDRIKGTFIVNTPRTVGVYAPEGNYTLGAVDVHLDDLSTLFVNSLDGRSLDVSDHLLVTHLTDVLGEGACYQDESMHILYEWGRIDPVTKKSTFLVKRGRATVSLPIKAGSIYEVWAIGTDGRRECMIDTIQKDGRLMFEVNTEQSFGGCLGYEIVKKRDLCDLVDPFWGCGAVENPPSEGMARGWNWLKAQTGNTHPGAVMPFGWVSACAYSGNYSSGYGRWGNSSGGSPRLVDAKLKAYGFTHFHNSGVGYISKFYNYFLFTPSGPGTDVTRASVVINEKASPGYYAATLSDYGASFELVSRPYAACHRYRFSSGKGVIHVDLRHAGLRSEAMGAGSKYREQADAWNAQEIDARTWGGVVRLCGLDFHFAVRAKGEVGAIVCNEGVLTIPIGSPTAETVIGFSLVDGKEALARAVEAEEVGFERSRDQAAQTWESALGRIRVEFSDRKLKDRFYSALYHSLVKPVDCGTGFLDYSTMWDVYKTQLPLVLSTQPQVARRMMLDMLKVSEELGFFPLTQMMTKGKGRDNGQAAALATYTLADAFFRGVLTKAEYPRLKRAFASQLDGTKTEGKSPTYVLDLAGACFAASCVAESCDDPDYARELRARADVWRSVYDPTTGYLVKDASYYEGNFRNYSFRPHVGMSERVALAGGDVRFGERLNDFFRVGYAPTDWDPQHERVPRPGYFEGLNNESDMEAPYSYLWAGRGDRLAEVIDAVRRYRFTDGEGGCPGNNDSGGTSAWYVWSCLGLYPLTGTPCYLIGSPSVDSAEIDFAKGRLRIQVRRESPASIYPKEFVFKGKVFNEPWVRVDDLEQGGLLEIRLKDSPGKTPIPRWLD